MFAGARAYIGMLIPVTGAEAAQVAEFFVGHDEGMPLAEALSLAQNKTYGQSQMRRPYIMTGVYPPNLSCFRYFLIGHNRLHNSGDGNIENPLFH